MNRQVKSGSDNEDHVRQSLLRERQDPGGEKSRFRWWLPIQIFLRMVLDNGLRIWIRRRILYKCGRIVTIRFWVNRWDLILVIISLTFLDFDQYSATIYCVNISSYLKPKDVRRQWRCYAQRTHTLVNLIITSHRPCPMNNPAPRATVVISPPLFIVPEPPRHVWVMGWSSKINRHCFMVDTILWSEKHKTWGRNELRRSHHLITADHRFSLP